MTQLKERLDNTVGWFLVSVSLLISVGIVYWLWLAFKVGSVGMAVVGLVPPFSVATGSVGAWAMFFGTPEWVDQAFG